MGHTFSDILVHLIFSTKDRRPTISTAMQPRRNEYLAGVARQEFGQALRIGGADNHIHGLIRLRTDVSVAEAVRKWKSLSSRWTHKTFADAGTFAWQIGYGAFSVSGPRKKAVIDYIDGQAGHHRKVTFEEEFLAFLRRYEVHYDPEHVWD